MQQESGEAVLPCAQHEDMRGLLRRSPHDRAGLPRGHALICNPRACKRERAKASFEQKSLQPRASTLRGSMRDSMSAIYLIEAAIIAAQRGTDGMAIKDLLDKEALAAVETTIKNFETEESGVIYEHRAASPRIQEVSRRIREGSIN